MISPVQHQQIMIIPHLHLSLLLAGKATVEQLQSVTGLLNIGSALAYLKRDPERQGVIHAGLKAAHALALYARDQVVPAPDELHREQIMSAVRLVDRWLGVQHTATLEAAIDFVDRRLQGGAEDTVLLERAAGTLRP